MVRQYCTSNNIIKNSVFEAYENYVDIRDCIKMDLRVDSKLPVGPIVLVL